jgi:ATP-dependent exoDNAse (exonuclease V) alpha subunit
MTPVYAFTDYRSQGQTINPVLIDIGPPPSGGLTPFNAYVALSRGQSRENIRLLRDFDDKIFTEHPSEFLRLFDERWTGKQNCGVKRFGKSIEIVTTHQSSEQGT